MYKKIEERLKHNKGYLESVQNFNKNALKDVCTYYDSRAKTKIKMYCEYLYVTSSRVTHGVVTRYRKNGTISSTEMYYHGNTIKTTYYFKNGKISNETYYDIDKEISYYKNYYNNGKIASEGYWYSKIENYFYFASSHIDESYNTSNIFNYRFDQMSSESSTYTLYGNLSEINYWFNGEHRVIIVYKKKKLTKVKYQLDYYDNYVELDILKNEINICNKNQKTTLKLGVNSTKYIDYQSFYNDNKHLFYGAI